MAEVAVVGPGSVGAFFAAHLAASGRDVLACARRPFDEYVIESPSVPVRAAANVVTDPGDVDRNANWVLVAVKSQQTDAAAPWLDRLCGPDTTVVVLQNGIEGEERLAPLCGEAEVVAAVVYCATELVAPGHVVHRQSQMLIVPEREASHRFAALFGATPIEIRVTDAYLTEAWRKLGINVMANGVTALTGRPLGVFHRPDIELLGRRLLLETWAVAAADGAELGPADVDAFFEGFGQVDPEGPTSMLQDRRAGRATEHDALYGAVIRAGARLGIATPMAETVGALLAALEEG
jgi:2-dehydropantoate 2-reductase